jgi:hypothetical protein
MSGANLVAASTSAVFEDVRLRLPEIARMRIWRLRVIIATGLFFQFDRS